MPAFPVRRKDFYFLFLIIILGILFRMAYLEDYKNSKVFQPLPFSDTYSYMQRAQDINAGKFLSPKIFISWPLYAYFLALLFKISGGKVLFVYVAQFLMGVGNTILIYFIARRIFNATIGFIAALLCLWYGLFMFYEGLLIYTSLALFLNSLFFLFILDTRARPTRRRVFLAGVFLGLCTLTQATIVLFGIITPFWLLRQNRIPFTRGIIIVSCFVAGLALSVGTATFMNYLADKDFVIVSRNAGLNFFLGNNRESRGVFACPEYLTATQEGMYRDSRIIAHLSLDRTLTSSEVSRFWVNRSMAFILLEPAAFLRLMGYKTALIFNPKELISEPEFQFIAPSARIFKILFPDLRFILPLGLAGMALAARKFKQYFLLYMIVTALSLNIIVFFFQTKLRIVMVPFLALFAAYAVYFVWEKLREKKLKQCLLLAAGISAFISVFQYSFFAGKPVLSADEEAYAAYRYHFESAMYYETKSDYTRALEELKRAQEMRPDSRHVLFSIGAVYFELKDFKNAESYFYRAIRKFPFYIDAYYNLGFLYNQQGRFKEAAEALQKAVYFDPEDTGCRFELARAYKGMNNFEKAKTELRNLLLQHTALSPAEKGLVTQTLSGIQ